MAKIIGEEDPRTKRAAAMAEETGRDELDGNAWLKDVEKVEFINQETPGMSLSFAFGSTKNPQKYTLFHGGIYDLPRKIIKHLEQCGRPLYDWVPDGTGSMVKKPRGFIPRFSLRRV